MKTLWLLRHAKSSWKDSTLTDHDRPLKKRGKKAAAAMGQLLGGLSPFPDIVQCSTAVRARETWQIVGETIAEQHELPAVEYLEALYHASPETMRSIIANFPPAAAAVLLVGHNPGLEEFVWETTSTETDVPTATLVKIEFSAESWTDAAAAGKGTLAGVWRPRSRD